LSNCRLRVDAKIGGRLTIIAPFDKLGPMKKIFVLFILLQAALAVFAVGKKDESILHIYSVVNEEETKALAARFTEKTGIKVEYIRAATGELVNRAIAEKNAPQADIFLGGSQSLHVKLDEEGALLSYRPAGSDALPANVKAADGGWTGFCLLTLGIGINTNRFAEKFPGKKLPATWDDLNDAAYKGELVFTDPTASATGYLFLQSQLNRLGEAGGFAYFKKLYPLAGQLPGSGNAPPKFVSTGEYTLGVAYVHALEIYSAQGYPITIVVPPETPGEVDAVAILKNTANEAAAKKFADFMFTVEAAEIFTKLSHTISVVPGVKPNEGGISFSDLKLAPYDSDKAGRDRDRILVEWQAKVLN
jgi:iron(III) transport system substrate-binding protein